VNVGGLDDEKLSVLSQWAAGLQRDSRAEVVAAGRAIELLIDEIERLHVLLWAGPLDAVPTDPDPDDARPLVRDEPEPARSLRQRLQHRLAGTPRTST